jgi:hypothetical protein
VKRIRTVVLLAFLSLCAGVVCLWKITGYGSHAYTLPAGDNWPTVPASQVEHLLQYKPVVEREWNLRVIGACKQTIATSCRITGDDVELQKVLESPDKRLVLYIFDIHGRRGPSYVFEVNRVNGQCTQKYIIPDA